MKRILEEMEKLSKLTETLEETKNVSLNQGKILATNKLNMLYRLLKPYSDILNLIPGINKRLEVIIRDEKNNYCTLLYTNGQWTLNSKDRCYTIQLKQAEINYTNYEFFAIKRNFIQSLNEELILQKIQEQILEKIDDCTQRTIMKIQELNKSLEMFSTNISINCITSILESLFDINNDFKNTGNEDLVKIISSYITTLEEILKGGE